ncbi:MAG: hypothetical protein Q9221_009128 [Calogaya cf. arnoldii]
MTYDAQTSRHTSEDASKTLDEHADRDDQDDSADSAEIPAVVAEKPEAAEEGGDHSEQVGMESWDAGDTFLFFIESDKYRHKKYQRFLLLRIKRASKYWDCLWCDIILEVKELLAGVDDNYYLRKRNKNQLVGAASPAVILAVGLEVRLFEWDAASGILTETNPDRVYPVMDEEGRKAIEAVLTSAVERLETAELKEEQGFHDEESDVDS